MQIAGKQKKTFNIISHWGHTDSNHDETQGTPVRMADMQATDTSRAGKDEATNSHSSL